MKLLGVFLFALLGMPAQTMVAPLAGTIVDGHGRIALLHGVMGNLLPPKYAAVPPELQGEAILSAAFNTNGGALKTESHLVLLDSEGAVVSVQAAPPGTALFSFSADGSLTWVLYPADAELVNIASGASINAAGFGDAVVALGTASAASIPLLTSDVQRQFWSGVVSVPDGVFAAQSAVSGAAPCSFFQGGWLTSTITGLFWSPLTAGTPAFPIALPESVRTLQIASAGAVVVNSQLLVNARFQVLEIPHAPPFAPPKGTIGNPPVRSER